MYIVITKKQFRYKVEILYLILYSVLELQAHQASL